MPFERPITKTLAASFCGRCRGSLVSGPESLLVSIDFKF